MSMEELLMEFSYVLKVYIDEGDRWLNIDLPKDMSSGSAEVTIEIRETEADSSLLTHEKLEAKLRAAGKLRSFDIDEPWAGPITPAEFDGLTRLFSSER